MKKNSWGAFLHITINKINFHRDPQIIEHRCRSRRRKDQASGCHHKDSISHLLPTKPDWNPGVFSRVLSSLPQKLAHREKHLSVSPSGLKEHRPRSGSIKSGGCPVSLRNILAVKSSDFLILSYSTYLSDQLAVGLENHENFPVSAQTFLQITAVSAHVSRRHGVSSLATSGQKILSRGNVLISKAGEVGTCCTSPKDRMKSALPFCFLLKIISSYTSPILVLQHLFHPPERNTQSIISSEWILVL